MAPELTEICLSETTAKCGLSQSEDWLIKQNLFREHNRSFHSIGTVLKSLPLLGMMLTDIIKVRSIEGLWKNRLRWVEVDMKLDTDNETCIREINDEVRSRFLELSDAESVLLVKEVPEDILDWDAYIKTPPPAKVSGTIKVRFKLVNKSKPSFSEDPWV